MATTTKTFTRGQLARACDIGSEAIRFYERQGLLVEQEAVERAEAV